jgi:hypothetical protein
MSDFFVSYTEADKTWATWIAWVLEEAGYSTLIQAWDMRGNFVTAMRDAMRNTDRTIGVMSRAALASEFVAVEWQGALRGDPLGREDRLVLFRVDGAEAEDSWLAQYAFIDLADLGEKEAQQAVLDRVAKGRGKPAQRVAFPSSTASQPKRNVSGHPPYPAESEDAVRLTRVRDVARNWRGKWAPRLTELRESARQARAAQATPSSQLSAQQRALLDLAAEVARSFGVISKEVLKSATSYGLHVHLTVLGGIACETAIIAANPNRQHPLSPYQWENIARVFESAASLASFDIDKLPRGFLNSGVLPVNLATIGPLFFVRDSNQEGLALWSPAKTGEPVGRIVARPLQLHVHAARLNCDGQLDVVASDRENLYGWWGSSAQPTHQIKLERRVTAAAFSSQVAGAPAIIVDSKTISFFGPDAEHQRHVIRDGSPSPSETAIWVDDNDYTNWTVLFVDSSGECTLIRSTGGTLKCDPWSAPIFGEAPWRSYSGASVSRVDGFDCFIVWRKFEEGHGVCFVDPMTLAPLRESLLLDGGPQQWIDLVAGGGRWLIAACMQHHDDPQPKALLFDLKLAQPNAQRPVARALARYGDLGTPVVLAANHDALDMAFVGWRQEAGSSGRSVVRWQWPSAQESKLLDGDGLWIWAVDSPAK